jgi:hypothetical protein
VWSIVYPHIADICNVIMKLNITSWVYNSVFI